MSSATAVTSQGERQVARPLKVLIPLIQDDLRQGNEAAERASLPYYRAAGEKMLEAKSQLNHGEFEDWVRRQFNISSAHARRYMALARTTPDVQNARGRAFSLTEAIGEQPRGERGRWPEEISEVLKKAKEASVVRQREHLAQAEEREEQRKLALQLIDIGYKALASKLHPDKGGSRGAMTRLNAVRDRLKQNA